MSNLHRRERKKARREVRDDAASGKPRTIHRYNWIHDNNGPGITARDEVVDIEESVFERNQPDIDAERSIMNIKRTYFGSQEPKPDVEPPRPHKGKSVLFDKVPKWKRTRAENQGT